jgi:hypothetical protein
MGSAWPLSSGIRGSSRKSSRWLHTPSRWSTASARLAGPKRDFAEPYKAWRESVRDEDLELEPDYWDSVRDRSPGRDVEL